MSFLNSCLKRKGKRSLNSVLLTTSCFFLGVIFVASPQVLSEQRLLFYSFGGFVLLVLAYNLLSSPLYLQKLVCQKQSPVIIVFLTYALYVLSSILWVHTVTEQNIFLIEKTILEVGLCITLVAYVRIMGVETVLDLVFNGFLIGCVISAIAVLLLGSGFQNVQRLSTDEMGSTFLGHILSIGILISIYKLRLPNVVMLNRIFCCLCIGLFGYTLLLTFSKTSTVALLVAIAVFLFVRKTDIKKYIQYGMYFFAGVSLLLAVLWEKILVSLLYYMKWSFNTLSGRTDLWERALEEIPKSPIVGHGIGAFVSITDDIGNGFTCVHNEILHTFYHYGIIGMALVFSIYYLYLKSALSLSHSKVLLVRLKGSFCIALCIYFLMKGAAESSSTLLMFRPWLVTITALWLYSYSKITTVLINPQLLSNVFTFQEKSDYKISSIP